MVCSKSPPCLPPAKAGPGPDRHGAVRLSASIGPVRVTSVPTGNAGAREKREPFRLADRGTLVRDEDRMARPAFLQASTHLRDFHEKSVEAETLLELAVLPRRPHGQRSAGTQCRSRRGNAAIV